MEHGIHATISKFMKRLVLIKYYATVYVEADTEEECIELAIEEAGYMSSSSLEMDEASIDEVLDGKTEEEIQRIRKIANCESVPNP